MSAAPEILTFKPLTGQDLPMVHAWLQRPHVAEWWHEPTSLVELERDYLPCPMRESSTRAYIAILDGEPIGFIQSYVAMGAGEGWWEQEADPGARGIDQFLANAEQLGRGLGSNMVTFGTKTAHFHICSNCGVAPVVTSRIDGRLYAVVSVTAFEGVDPSLFRRGSATFDEESEEVRLARRKLNWSANVEYDA